MRQRELVRHIRNTKRLAKKMELQAHADFLRVLTKIRSMYDELITTVALEAGKAAAKKADQLAAQPTPEVKK